MTIHIYRTTDVDSDQFEALLEGANGPLRHLHFRKGDHVSVQAVTDMVRSASDAHGELGREEMFTILNRIRKMADLPEAAILVLLTRTRHDGNWFSIGEKCNKNTSIAMNIRSLLADKLSCVLCESIRRNSVSIL